MIYDNVLQAMGIHLSFVSIGYLKRMPHRYSLSLRALM